MKVLSRPLRVIFTLAMLGVCGSALGSEILIYKGTIVNAAEAHQKVNSSGDVKVRRTRDVSRCYLVRDLTDTRYYQLVTIDTAAKTWEVSSGNFSRRDEFFRGRRSVEVLSWPRNYTISRDGDSSNESRHTQLVSFEAPMGRLRFRGAPDGALTFVPLRLRGRGLYNLTSPLVYDRRTGFSAGREVQSGSVRANFSADIRLNRALYEQSSSPSRAEGLETVLDDLRSRNYTEK